MSSPGRTDGYVCVCVCKNMTDEEDEDDDDDDGTQTDLLYDVAEVGAQDDSDVGQGLVDVCELGNTR